MKIQKKLATRDDKGQQGTARDDKGRQKGKRTDAALILVSITATNF
jgi:hypothetical protein